MFVGKYGDLSLYLVCEYNIIFVSIMEDNNLNISFTGEYNNTIDQKIG